MKRIVIIAAFLLLFTQFTACQKNASVMPASGVWKNEELQIEIDMQSPRSRLNATVMVAGRSIACVAGADRGSSLLVISSQESIDGICEVGETLYEFEGINCSETQWLVRDRSTGSYYQFHRIR